MTRPKAEGIRGEKVRILIVDINRFGTSAELYSFDKEALYWNLTWRWIMLN